MPWTSAAEGLAPSVPLKLNSGVKVCAGRVIAVAAYSTETAPARLAQSSLSTAFTIRLTSAVISTWLPAEEYSTPIEGFRPQPRGQPERAALQIGTAAWERSDDNSFNREYRNVHSPWCRQTSDATLPKAPSEGTHCLPTF